MPCRDGGPSYEQTLQERIKQYDPLLCSACRALERLRYDFDENPALAQWWAAHQEADRRREEEEARIARRREVAAALTRKPLAELTPEEKGLLREFRFI